MNSHVKSALRIRRGLIVEGRILPLAAKDDAHLVLARAYAPDLC